MQTVVEGADTLSQRVGCLIETLIHFREQFCDRKLPDGMQTRIEILVA